MKIKYIILGVLISHQYLVFSQEFSNSEWHLGFDEEYSSNFLVFSPDTLEDYSWKIVTPDNSYNDKAIATAGNRFYSVNDTISFTIMHPTGIAIGYGGNTAPFRGMYRVDSDSISDFGLIEMSLDKGSSWMNMVSDSALLESIEVINLPILTGYSDWKEFWFDLVDLNHDFSIPDTIFFRFSFISDEIQNNRTGLFFDDIYLVDRSVNIKRNQDILLFHSKAFPNPGSSQIEISFDQSSLSEYNLQIFNSSGKLVYFESDKACGNIKVDVSRYERGMYLYRLMDIRTGFRSSGKFLVDP